MFSCPFTVNGELFLCMEQFFMVTKARFFGNVCNGFNMQLIYHLFSLRDPVQMKREAAFLTALPINRSCWRASAAALILPGLIAKFSQNYVLSKLLIGMGDRRFVEASPSDKFWGVGLSLTNPNLNFPDRHCGQNMMGQCLSKVRGIIN